MNERVCRCLRTKMQYVVGPDGEGVWDRTSSSAGYWCLRTMYPMGPDEGLVTPGACRQGRECFEASPDD
jgi:hypothetical protein